jgi:hypothetical protein
VTDRLHVPGLGDDEERTLNLLVEQLDKRSKRNCLRSSYYDGKYAVRQIGSVIPPQYAKLGLVLGWSAKAVDTLARRCNLDTFVWPEGDLASLGFRDTWDQNFLGQEIASARTASLIHGVSFLINTQGVEGEPKSLVHAKDALNATGEWNTRTRALDSLLSVTSRDPESNERITGFVLYLPGVTISASKTDGKWEVDRSDHPWGVPAEPMIYKPRTGRPLGSSRISRAVMSLHNQALRTVIRLEAHMDIYAIPKLIMLGANESIFKNADGSTKTSWQVVMGRIFGIPDDEDAPSDQLARADVKQFSAESPEPQITALKQQAMLFSGETSIPLTSLGVSDLSNPTSADSYIASREDLIAEAEGATDDWSPSLRRMILRALAIQNGLEAVPPAWQSIEPKWRSPIYLSRAASADAGLKQLQAIPWLAETEVGLELLGLDEQQIQRALADRRRAAGRGVLDALRQRAEVPEAPAPPVNGDDGN